MTDLDGARIRTTAPVPWYRVNTSTITVPVGTEGTVVRVFSDGAVDALFSADPAIGAVLRGRGARYIIRVPQGSFEAVADPGVRT